MDSFEYQSGRLHCETLPAADLAERHGTPLYVYSAATLAGHFERLRGAFAELAPLICYAVKSCPNLHICRRVAQLGGGFDVVSGGELFRALQAGADAKKIVFAGVGKTDVELREALDAGIGLFNAESERQVERIAAQAHARGVRARVALRVNPDVDARTHQFTTTGRKENKFGVDWELAEGVFERCARLPGLELCGLHLHIGSPVNDVSAYRAAVERGMAIVHSLRRRGFGIDVLDIGGGFGAFYAGGEAPPATAYADAIVPALRGAGLRIVMEPGRSLIANAGILLTRVVEVKASGERTFVIIDASMNELIRPALYGAYHFIWPVEAGALAPVGRGAEQPHAGLSSVDVVGPVCESADFLAKQRPLPRVREGDLLAVFSAGAYAMSMASQYNSRPRAAEVLVDGAATQLIRRRETYEDLVAAERI